MLKGDESIQKWRPIYEEFQKIVAEQGDTEQNEVPIEEMVVRGNRGVNQDFSIEGWNTLLEVFLKDPYVSRLRFENETVNMPVAELLVKNLKGNNKLQHLDLYNNQIEEAVAAFLLKNLIGLDGIEAPEVQLHSINLSGNLLASDQVDNLQELIKECPVKVTLT